MRSALLLSLFATLASAAVIPRLEPRTAPSMHTLEVPEACNDACGTFTDFRNKCLQNGLRDTGNECLQFCLKLDELDKCYSCIADNGDEAARELVGPDQVCNKYGNMIFTTVAGETTGAGETATAKCRPKQTGGTGDKHILPTPATSAQPTPKPSSTSKPAAGATLENPGACTERCKVFALYKDCLTGQGRSASCMNSCQRLDEINDCYKCISESEGGEDMSARLDKAPGFCSSSSPLTSTAGPAPAPTETKPDTQAIANLQTPDECAAECTAFRTYQADCFGNGAKGHGCMAHCGREEEVNKCYDCMARVANNDDALKYKGPIQNSLCPKN